jgi:putative endonuclease
LQKWCLYVLLCADGTYYTGITTEIGRRLTEHNSTAKGAKYTRGRRPVRLVYYKAYEDRSSAQKAEHKFKRLRHAQKARIIEKYTKNR